MSDIIGNTGQVSDFQSPIEIIRKLVELLCYRVGKALLEILGGGFRVLACVDIGDAHGCGFAFSANRFFQCFCASVIFVRQNFDSCGHKVSLKC